MRLAQISVVHQPSRSCGQRSKTQTKTQSLCHKPITIDDNQRSASFLGSKELDRALVLSKRMLRTGAPEWC